MVNETVKKLTETEDDIMLEELETKISAGTIARTIFLLITMINAGLAMFGKTPLPFKPDEAQIYTEVSFVLHVVAAVLAWWKNNSFTRPAILGDWFMNQVKEDDV